MVTMAQRIEALRTEAGLSRPAAPQSATMLDALFAGKAAREQFKAMVLEVLRSPEGQAVIAQAVWKELAKHK